MIAHVVRRFRIGDSPENLALVHINRDDAAVWRFQQGQPLDRFATLARRRDPLLAKGKYKNPGDVTYTEFRTPPEFGAYVLSIRHVCAEGLFLSL